MSDHSLVPALPDTPAGRGAVELVRKSVSEPVANHSFRSYVFAVLLAEHEGMKAGAEFDADLLFHACVLHDLGTSASAPGKERFEVEGADMAAEFLRLRGYGTEQVDAVWEAVALHTSGGIADRRGALVYLTHHGIGADFGLGAEYVTDAQGEALHARYARLNMATALVDDIIRQAARSPEGSDPYTIPGTFLRERSEIGSATTLELVSRDSRWGA
ncbi:HD domain-containing protein [Nonomuraea endophytica]|uniref:HD domain-containing protein n=1 Tax=Nonomuraea endophytica TaxID=714136 RepID=UPI0037C86CD4